MSLAPFCPYCGMPVEVDAETGLITFCLGCEGGVDCYPNYQQDDWDYMEA